MQALLLWPVQQLGDSWSQNDQMMMNYFTLLYDELELLMLHKSEEIFLSNDNLLQFWSFCICLFFITLNFANSYLSF